MSEVVRHVVPCPSCGHEVPIRAALGQGTQRGRGMALNDNRKAILSVLRSSGRPLTVQEVLQALRDHGIERQSKKGTGWNYHTVQADLSLLLGGGHIQMGRPHELTIFDDEGFRTITEPIYFVPGGAA